MTNKVPEKKKRGRPVKKKESKVNGRPTSYNETIVGEIYDRLSDGESLRKICRDKEMPTYSTVMLWRAKNRSGFSDIYLEARENQGHAMGDKVFALTEDLENGKIAPQVAKIASDNYKWMAERLAHKTYGSKTENKLTGDDQQPLHVNSVGSVDVNLITEAAKKALDEY